MFTFHQPAGCIHLLQYLDEREHVLTLSCHLRPCCWVVAGLWESCYFPGFALFFIKCTCFCRPKMKSPDCSREGEVKHQNGTKKVGIWKINCVNFCSYYFLPQETVIPPTSPILNHEDVEENSHEMVIIQSDKSSGNLQQKTALLSPNLKQYSL